MGIAVELFVFNCNNFIAETEGRSDQSTESVGRVWKEISGIYHWVQDTHGVHVSVCGLRSEELVKVCFFIVIISSN
jgi:hypothetical protein